MTLVRYAIPFAIIALATVSACAPSPQVSSGDFLVRREMLKRLHAEQMQNAAPMD